MFQKYLRSVVYYRVVERTNALWNGKNENAV
jgi:hypothetical protein